VLELIVLGQIPGTNTTITFDMVLLMLLLPLSFLSILLIIRNKQLHTRAEKLLINLISI
jgi:hypothetical protein